MLQTLKRRWYYFAPLALLLVPVTILLFYSVNYGYNFAESWLAFRYFGHSDTRYAQKYSEAGLNSIRAGMRGDEVFKIIGVPFERRDSDRIWHYSFPQGDAQFYHERAVVFEKDAQGVPRVKSIIRRFHYPQS